MKTNYPRIFCVGRNYSLHAKELGNAIPKEPVIFIKPYSCLTVAQPTIAVPHFGSDLQHELELVLKIGDNQQVSHIALGIDLTLRDIQSELKKAGLPWEKAKAFENSAPVTKFIPLKAHQDLNDISFHCYVNDELRQQGHSGDMLFSAAELLIYIRSIWQLLPGDVIFTGTPAGVNSLTKGDVLRVSSDFISHQWTLC